MGPAGHALGKSHTALEFNNIPGERRNRIHAHKPSHSRQTLERHPALFLPAALTGRWFQSQPDNSRTPDRVIESFAMSGSPALASHPTPQSRRDGRPEAVLGFWKGCIRPRIAAKLAGADRSTPDGPGLRAVPLARRRRVCPALLTGRAAGCEAANWLLPPPPPPLCAPNSQHHEAGQDQVCTAACRRAWRGECLAGEGGASFSRRWQASGNFESCNLLLCVCAGSRSINVS